MKISNIIMRSLLAVTLLLASEMYALKRTHSQAYESDENNQPPRKIQRRNEATDVSMLRAGDVFMVLPNEEAVRNALTTLLPHTRLSFEEMGLFKDNVVSLTPDNQLAFLHTNIIDNLGTQLVEEYPCNQEVRKHICDNLHALVNSLIMRFAEESRAIGRALAQRYAREMVAGHDISIRLIFALLADYLQSPFFKLVAWNSFTSEEKEACFANLNEVESGESDKLTIPFYSWEKSLEACAINGLSDTEQAEHLLDPNIHVVNSADNVLTDFVIGCLLYDKTNNCELVFTREQFAALNFIIESCSVVTSEARNMTGKLQALISSSWVCLNFSLISIRSYEPVSFTKHIFNFLCMLPGLKDLHIAHLETYMRGVSHSIYLLHAKSEQSREIMQIVTHSIQRLGALESLSIVGNAGFLYDAEFFVEKNSFSLLVNALTSLRHLKELRLSYNNLNKLSNEQWNELMAVVAALPHITVLDVSGNSLQEDAANPYWEVIMSWLHRMRRKMCFNA